MPLNNDKDTFKIYREFQNSKFNVEDLYDYYKENKTNDGLKKLMNKNETDMPDIYSNLLKQDVTLNLDVNSKKLEFYKDRIAIARMIQNIIVTKKGTYPNNPTFGVGIEDYLFDLSTSKVESDLTSDISEQLSMWLENNNGIRIEFELKFIKDTTNINFNTLAIFFKVYSNNKEGNTEEFKFTLFFTGDTLNRKVVSKLDL